MKQAAELASQSRLKAKDVSKKEMRRLKKLRKKAEKDAVESAPAEAAEKVDSTVILSAVDSESPQWLLWRSIAYVKESDIDDTLNEINTYLTQINLS